MLRLISAIFICICICLTAWIPSISAFYGNFVVCTAHAQCWSNWCGPTDKGNDTVCNAPLATPNVACGNDRECRSQLCINNQCATRGVSGIGGSGARCTSKYDCDTSNYICKLESNECGFPGSRLNIRDAGCGVSEQCDTNTCDFMNGICFVRSCTTHYQCPRDMFCGSDGNQPNAPKICKKKERQYCTTSLQCESGMCSDWCLYPALPVPISQLYRAEEIPSFTVPQGQYCFASQHCAHGLYCAPGDVCMPKLNEGQACRSIEACNSGYCKGGICVAPGTIGTWCTTDANCTSSNYCATIATNKKQCMLKGTIGAACTYPNHNMCDNGKCDTNGRCIITNGVNANCSVNAPCSYDTYCDASTSKCLAKLSENSQCSDNIQCMSGVCNNEAFRQCTASIPGTYGAFCNSINLCDNNHYCRTGISPVVCLPKGTTGAPCSSATQCISNNCYGTPLRCIIPGQIGTPCTSHQNCTAGSYCPTVGTRICTVLLGLGDKCNNAATGNASCASGWCSGNLCHAPPAARSAGSACNTHTDCDSGLWCWSTPDGISTCHPKRSDGNKCQFPETCISGICGNNICGGSPNPNGYATEDATPTSTSTSTPTPTTSAGGATSTPTPTTSAGGATSTPTATSPAGGATSTPTPTSSAGATTTPPTSTPASSSSGSGSGPNSDSLCIPTIWSLLWGMLSLMMLV